jgi:hypothetical protein
MQCVLLLRTAWSRRLDDNAFNAMHSFGCLEFSFQLAVGFPRLDIDGPPLGPAGIVAGSHQLDIIIAQSLTRFLLGDRAFEIELKGRRMAVVYEAGWCGNQGVRRELRVR